MKAMILPQIVSLEECPQVTTYPLEEANTALLELKRGQIRGAKVLLNR